MGQGVVVGGKWRQLYLNNNLKRKRTKIEKTENPGKEKDSDFQSFDFYKMNQPKIL